MKSQELLEKFSLFAGMNSLLFSTEVEEIYTWEERNKLNEISLFLDSQFTVEEQDEVFLETAKKVVKEIIKIYENDLSKGE